MSTIIARPARPAHPEPRPHPDPHPEPHPDAAARQRRDLLARATARDMETALAFLGMIDPDAFEIALTAVRLRADETPMRPAIPVSRVSTVSPANPRDAASPKDAPSPEDDEPFPVCRHCGAPVGIFPDHGLHWQHFRGDDATSGTQNIYHPGHPAQATWLLPGEDPDELQEEL